MTDIGAYAWRDLAASDLQAIVVLHNRVLAALPDPDLVRPESAKFFAGILGGDGRMTGVFAGSELIAYGVFQWRLEPGDDPRATLGLSPATPIGKLAGVVVAAGHRGVGLQGALIRRRVEQGITLGFRHVYSTSAPANWPSWSNLVQQGFRVVALQLRYGGLLRFLLYHRVTAAPEPFSATPQPCDPTDTERLQHLLDSGYRGVGVRRRADGRRVLLLARSRSD